MGPCPNLHSQCTCAYVQQVAPNIVGGMKLPFTIQSFSPIGSEGCILYKNGSVALTRVGYLSNSFTTKLCEYKQINYYIAGQVSFAISDMQVGKQLSQVM